jgi:hypothetical protein
MSTTLVEGMKKRPHESFSLLSRLCDAEIQLECPFLHADPLALGGSVDDLLLVFE